MKHFASHSDLDSFEGVLLDCRFSLLDERAGHHEYLRGHVPGSLYLDLARDMSRATSRHGGRHPLPETAVFARTLARLGIGPDTEVICYDDSKYVFAARCWWMMRALGYREPRILAGGYAAWLTLGLAAQAGEAMLPDSSVELYDIPDIWPQCCDREGLVELQARGAQLIDAREAVRYRGEHEPIDPIAGHIPGAANFPWQDMLGDDGVFLGAAALRERWHALGEAESLVVYCGSGVSACVNLLALDIIGRDEACLYAGSWSDWCSYLATPDPV